MTMEKRAKIEDSTVDLGVEENIENSTESIDNVVAEYNRLAALTFDDVNLNISEAFLAIECRLTNDIDKICFTFPVAYVYKPIFYAFDVHSNYVKKYCKGKKKILFLGMNAGPFGMSQTGVPFGEIDAVVNWLQISGTIRKPEREHPYREVTGFDCKRSEISGKKFWKLFRKICENPEIFFQYSFVHNYCPIALMKSSGHNVTPNEIKAGPERKTLENLCDAALIDVVKLLEVEKIISIGRYSERRARNVIKRANLETDVQVLYIPHPSPRSRSNSEWVADTEEKLRELNLLNYFTNEQNLPNVNANN